MKVLAEPICTPLPGIPGHRVETICVGWKGVGRASLAIAVLSSVHPRELSLPDVTHVLTLNAEFVSPRVEFLHKASTRGILPFCFCWKPLTTPRAVCLCVIPRDMHYQMVGFLMKV